MSTRLTIEGTGTETLSGANTYTGPIAVSAGTLQVGASNAIPSTSDVTDNATFDLDGHSDSSGALSGSHTVTRSTPGSATLTVGATNDNAGFSGVIQAGSGTVALIMGAIEELVEPAPTNKAVSDELLAEYVELHARWNDPPPTSS